MGRCHICRTTKPVRYCSRCGHWFCQDCRRNYFWRGLAAVVELVRGAVPGCCGLEVRNA